MFIRKSAITLFSFLIISVTLKRSNAFRSINVDGMTVVLAVENENITFECMKDVPMSYCGFIHPNGTNVYSFTGVDSIAGHCAVKIMVTKNDNGMWQCHIGHKSPGLEVIQRKYVRVADRLAALTPNISTVHGKQVVIRCATTQKMVPLSYCRFVPPSGAAFNIDATVTSLNPILERYYFPPNSSLDRGDCAVVIRKIHYDDVGPWICGAGLEDDEKEYTDTIVVDVEGLYTMSTASATGITLGVVIVIVLVITLAVITWKKHLHVRAQAAPVGNEESIEIQELHQPRSPGTPIDICRSSVRRVPSVVIQSPSEPSNSSATST